MKKIHYVFGLLMGIQVFGQSALSISGTVVNQQTGAPLPFATIGIVGSPYGTISNAEGAFDFYIPNSYSADTLSISHVGFETYTAIIREVKNPVMVSLKESVIVLEEVEVNGEQLTANQIIEKALERLAENYSTKPVIIRGSYRDIRDQNGETVSLTEAALDIQDIGISKPRKFFMRGVRASHSRINPLLAGSLLNSGNSLMVNLGHNYWLNSLRHRISKIELNIEDVIYKDGELFYVITSTEHVAKDGLAEKYKEMKYELVHRYLVHCETYAIHKIEHLESPLEGKYVAIEHPYEGDTLFYSKKGWNQTIELEEYEGKMYLKYHDVNYTFDIVDEKNDAIYLDMAYQFIFITTEIETDQKQPPKGQKMNRNRPMSLQWKGYDSDFWEDPSNAKLVPLTKKQIQDLEKHQPLEEQFRSKKIRLKKNSR